VEVDGLRELRRGEFGKNSLVPIRTKFISTAVSSPTITDGSLSGNNACIEGKRLFAGCPLYRSTSKLNGIFAQHKYVPQRCPSSSKLRGGRIIKTRHVLHAPRLCEITIRQPQVIDELISSPLSDSYVEYLRNKMKAFAGKKLTESMEKDSTYRVQKPADSDDR
jgi:hypothetical protein